MALQISAFRRLSMVVLNLRDEIKNNILMEFNLFALQNIIYNYNKLYLRKASLNALVANVVLTLHQNCKAKHQTGKSIENITKHKAIKL